MTRHVVSSVAVREQSEGYSRAVRVGSVVYVAGTTAAAESAASSAATTWAPRGGRRCGGSPSLLRRRAPAWTREALRRIAVALAQAGARTGARRPQPHVRNRHQPLGGGGRVHGEVFDQVRPAATMVEVCRLIDPALLVKVEVDAVAPEGLSSRVRVLVAGLGLGATQPARLDRGGR
jgi:enamine deaminase RidA (YjgF/YER057c/UK114 family)